MSTPQRTDAWIKFASASIIGELSIAPPSGSHVLDPHEVSIHAGKFADAMLSEYDLRFKETGEPREKLQEKYEKEEKAREDQLAKEKEEEKAAKEKADKEEKEHKEAEKAEHKEAEKAKAVKHV
jgi:hypothetical protein